MSDARASKYHIRGGRGDRRYRAEDSLFAAPRGVSLLYDAPLEGVAGGGGFRVRVYDDTNWRDGCGDGVVVPTHQVSHAIIF